MKDHIALLNGKIYTLDEKGTVAEALLIQGGKIKEVGSLKSIREQTGKKNILTYDLEGKPLLPGFIDTHVHLLETGLSLKELDLSGVQSLEEALFRIEERLKQSPKILKAHGFDPSFIKERRYLSRRELDKLSSSIPIVVRRRDHHSAVLNSAAFSFLALKKKSDEPLRGRDYGQLSLKLDRLIEEEEKREAFILACQSALKKGVTTLHSLVGRRQDPKNRDGELLVEILNELPLRVVPYLQTMNVEKVLDLGLPRIGGCLLIDGSIGSRTAALNRPYRGEPENRGLLYFSVRELKIFAKKAHSLNLQMAFHAIGDRAIEQILTIYESIIAEGRDSRHRIEHCELATDEQIERISKAGIALGMQPTFEYLWGGINSMYAHHLGKKRVLKTNRFRTLLDKGVMVAGGSDSPITPLDPILGIHSTVNHPNSSQRLKVKEAIELFTTKGAWIGFEEAKKGRIKKGMEADLVLLSEDPFKIPPHSLKEIRVEAVWIGGKRVI